MRRFAYTAVSASLLSLTAPALADATTQTYVSTADSNGNSDGAFGATYSSVSGAAASITGGPTLIATVSKVGDLSYAAAQADVTYQFSIGGLGGSAGSYSPGGGMVALTIPVTVTYAGYAFVGSQGQAVADLTVADMGGTAFEATLNCSSDGGSCGSMGGTQSFDFLWYYYGGGTTPGTYGLTGYVSMHVYAAGNDYGQGNFASTAWLDPTFTIDPTYAAAHPEVSLSVDAVPSAPVPEPGEWAMMAGGLGLVGAVVRRRKPR